MRLRWRACYGNSVAVTSGGTGCTLRGAGSSLTPGLIICAITGCFLQMWNDHEIDITRRHSTPMRSNSSLLLASQSADGHAVIHSCSPICNMQLNVLNDLAEAMKALDGKKSNSHEVTTDDILGAASAAANPRPVCPIVSSFEH